MDVRTGLKPRTRAYDAFQRVFDRPALPGGAGVLGRRGIRFAALLAPFLVALTSLGSSHSEAGILRTGGGTEPVPFATRADVALKPVRIQRRSDIDGYASGFRIPWVLAERIYDAAVNQGVEPYLAFGLVRVESSFRQRAIGPAGSIGYTQVQPGTATWLDPSVSREDLFEVETNLQLGFRYLRMLLDRYGSTRMALLAYNRGPGTVAGLLAEGEDPANGYASRVLSVRMRSAR